jgi:diaminopimelate epimerase
VTGHDAGASPGRRFWKMSGSGNDFVFIDGRTEPATAFQSAAVIQRICARGTGVGADGLVILSTPSRADADVAIRYFNADGSIASLCGNATLCTASLAARLGAVNPSGFAIETGSGVLAARVRDGVPEFDLPPVERPQATYSPIELEPGEERLGFATAGIPHVVIKVRDVSEVDVIVRGCQVRHDPSLTAGANVNFVSRDSGGQWYIRTYERGVEDETLACGTGSVATAILLNVWGDAAGAVELQTASGRILGVRSTQDGGGVWRASLRGEGRLVFEGELREI